MQHNDVMNVNELAQQTNLTDSLSSLSSTVFLLPAGDLRD